MEVRLVRSPSMVWVNRSLIHGSQTKTGPDVNTTIPSRFPSLLEIQIIPLQTTHRLSRPGILKDTVTCTRY